MLCKTIQTIQFKKLSRGEICVANFIPPANGSSLGSYFRGKNLTSA